MKLKFINHLVNKVDHRLVGSVPFGVLKQVDASVFERIDRVIILFILSFDLLQSTYNA